MPPKRYKQFGGVFIKKFIANWDSNFITRKECTIINTLKVEQF